MRSLTHHPVVVAVAIIAVSPPAWAQDKEPPKVDQDKVDEAIAKGSEWLRARVKEGLPPINQAGDGNHSGSTYNEIVLYTLLHAGVSRGDPDLIKLVNDIRSKPPVHTYTGAMRAMAFEMYDPVKLKFDLVQCAEFLVDNQGKNGMWGYSRPVKVDPIPNIVFTPTREPPKYIQTGSAGGAPPAGGPPPAPGGQVVMAPSGSSGTSGSGGTQVKKPPPKLLVNRRDWGSPNDNSNTQYAILGLRACIAAGVWPPPDCLPLTEKWYTEQQNDDGGWNYKNKGDKSYGSMTVGGVSSIAVCDRALRNDDPHKDARVQKALTWLGNNLKFDANPGKEDEWHFYWIYGVERAGAFSETEWFGDKPWYHDGAKWLLKHQHGDGTWGKDGDNKGDQILNTCWAILFLRRATKHIAQKVIFTGK